MKISDSLYFSLVFLIGGIIAIFFGIYLKYQEHNLDKLGVIVKSEPIASYREVIKNGTISDYEITARFFTAEGEGHHCTGGVSENFITNLVIRANEITVPTIYVKYELGNPDNCNIVGNKQLNIVALICIGFISALGGLIALLKSKKMENYS